MSKLSENIHILHNNPFILTPLLIEFYKESRPQKNNILLSFLIFPMLLHLSSWNTLKTKNKNRTIITFRKKGNEKLFGLATRLEEYKKMTSLCIQYGIDNKKIAIQEDMSISILEEMDYDEYYSGYIKASANLAIMLNHHDVVSIYRLLGLKKI